MNDKKVIRITFNSEPEFFVKVLNKVKNEKAESLTNLEKAQFFDELEKKIDNLEEIN